MHNQDETTSLRLKADETVDKQRKGEARIRFTSA